jgi:hypothetical protein
MSSTITESLRLVPWMMRLPLTIAASRLRDSRLVVAVFRVARRLRGPAKALVIGFRRRAKNEVSMAISLIVHP